MNTEEIPTGNTPAPQENIPADAVKKDERILEVQMQLQKLSDKMGEIISTMQSSANLIRSWIEEDHRNVK